MIDDVKDLTVIEKQKQAKRAALSRNFWIGFPLMIIGGVGTAMFALFMGGISDAATHTFVENFTGDYLGATIGFLLGSIVLFVMLFFGFYAVGETMPNAKLYKTGRNYLLAAMVVVINYMATVTVVCLLDYPYALPLMLTSLILLELLGRKEALMATGYLAILFAFSFACTDVFAAYAAYDILTSVLCNLIAALFVIFLVSAHFTRLKFILRALGASAAAVPFAVISVLACGALTDIVALEPMDILWYSLMSFGGSVASILVFMPLVAIFEGVFNIADDFKLDELCNLNQPLLKRLASEAPGTFNHSLVVGNLAEACAQAIGENPHLARCAAYYHDVGKLKAPIYFAENQSTYNPHDELIPEVSVSMITSHTLFGEILLKQYHLPPEIVAVAREHHGTSPVGYFYRKALSLTEDELDVGNYVYAGPKPQTRVAAIVMVADTIEAALRAYMPDTKEEFEARINKLVDEKLQLNQFDECPITMSDIATIKDTIIEVLPSIHHSRVSYEKKKK